MTDLVGAKGFIAAHINCRSLFPKIDFLRHLMYEKPVDVLCMSETWLKADIQDFMVELQGYNLIRHDRKHLVDGRSRTGGGVGMYLKKSINYKLHEGAYYSNPDIESFGVTLQMEQCRNFFIIVCYRPPSGNLDNFIETLTSILDSCYDGNHKLDLLIAGDINVDLSSSSNQCKLIDEFMKMSDLKQHIVSPTRITARTSSLLDHLYTNAVYIATAGVLDIGLSDHHLVYLIKKKISIKQERIIVSGRDYKKLDFEVDYPRIIGVAFLLMIAC